MRPLWEVLYFAVFVFWVLLIGRFILELVQNFARDWHPRGAILVVAEIIYTITDPPLRLVRRVVPPLPLGRIVLDLGLLIVFLLTIVVLTILSRAAAG